MAVMAREAWNDERLDDLTNRVDKGFEEVKGEIRDLRIETKAESSELRKEMNSRFNSLEARLTSMDARFDALQRTMVLGMVSMSATVVGALLVIQL